MESLLHSLSVAALIVVLVSLAGWIYQTVGSARDRRRYPPLGALFDVGGHRLHLVEKGQGSPAVILDAALGGSSISWQQVQTEISANTRVCSYDRAGLGWSEAGRGPRTARRLADELHALLGQAGVAPPYILVGHSFGGFSARQFAAQYPQEVAGMVLVDVPHPQEWARPSRQQMARLRRGAFLARRGAIVARFGVARLISLLARAGALGMARLGVALVSEGDLRGHEDRLLAPLFRVPPELRPVLRWFWTEPKFYTALAGQMELLVESAAGIAAAPGYGDLPLVVITASNPTAERLRDQEQVAGLSRRGRHIVAQTGGHWVQLDEPALVVNAIREVLEAARYRGRN